MKQPPMPTKTQAYVLQKLAEGWVFDWGIFQTAIYDPDRWHKRLRVHSRTMGVLNMNAWVTQSGETGAITDAGREALARYRQKEARRANR